MAEVFGNDLERPVYADRNRDREVELWFDRQSILSGLSVLVFGSERRLACRLTGMLASKLPNQLHITLGFDTCS